MRKEIFSLWNEAHEMKTPEARWLKSLDKLEMALQALDYELDGYSSRKLDSFWNDAKRKITEPDVIALLELAAKRRRKKEE